MKSHGSLVIVLLGFLGGCSRSEPPPTAASPSSQAFAPHWQDETQFIVESTIQDIAGMAHFARDRKAVAAGSISVEATEITNRGEPLTYRITVRSLGQPTVETTLLIDKAIWDPGLYTGLASQLLGKVPQQTVSAEAEKAGETMLRELTEPNAGVIEDLNDRISTALEADFTSSLLHERAALLVAALALREHSGKFFQIRSELGRMTAHLAFARGLQEGRLSSPEGRLAQAVLDYFCSNQREALQLLAELPAEDPWIAAWVRSLRMHITQDFRVFESIHEPTYLETREAFYARVLCTDVAFACARLSDEKQLQQSVDWLRCMNERGPSVELRHEILERAVPAELEEIRQVYARAFNAELPEETLLVGKLNIEPEPCVGSGGDQPVRVIGWGHWADFFQRHLCHAIQSDFDFLENAYNSAEDAETYRAGMGRRFQQLRLYPFVQRQNATEEKDYHQAQDASMAVARRYPHLMPIEIWNEVCYPVSFAPLYIPPPHAFINEWHRHNPPPGTGYDLYPRTRHPSMTGRKDYGAVLAALHQLAPYSQEITHYYLYQLAEVAGRTAPTAQDMAREFAATLDYDANLVAAIAQADESNAGHYELWMRKAASIDPYWDYELASFYVRQGRDLEAAEAYAKVLSADPDTVRFSNVCKWLVQYYERNGRGDEAAALALKAAKTYSGSGLATLAWLLESRGDVAGANDLYRKEYERYGPSSGLIGSLLLRVRAKGMSGLPSDLREIVAKVLPDGLRSQPLDSLRGPPERGVYLRDENYETRKAGLRPTDIIVVVRGYRVENSIAYNAVRKMESDTPFRLIFWRDGKYIESIANPPAGRFGVDLGDYRAK